MPPVALSDRELVIEDWGGDVLRVTEYDGPVIGRLLMVDGDVDLKPADVDLLIEFLQDWRRGRGA